MKFSVLFSVAGLVAVAAAQATTSPAVPQVSEIPKTKETLCLEACPESNVACQATCLGVPTPSEEDIAETLKCSTACVQGNGSPEETEAYGICLRKCAEKYFLPGTNTYTQKPTGTGTAPDQTATDNTKNTDTTGNGTGNGNGTTGGEDDKKSAASPMVYTASFAGLVGVVAAALTL